MPFHLTQTAGLPPSYNDADMAVPHGFFTAEGGVSTGLYDSLNCGFGSDDDAALVQANRDRAARSLGLDARAMAAVHQVHGNACVTLTGPSPRDRDALPRADGLVTKTPGLGLTILTADCLPVLFADPDAGVIGACHAGWRGACAGITGATVAAMRAIGASSITALIGPTIQPASYQVGADMRAALYAADDGSLPAETLDHCFQPDPAHDGPDERFRFNLPAYVRARLAGDGISDIRDCGLDTYHRDPDSDGESPRFFSHRRATHAGAADSGRQISIICLAR